MAQDDNGGKDVIPQTGSSAVEHALEESPGTAVIVQDSVADPGFPPHRQRVTDKDPKAAKQAERTVYTLFYLSIVGSVFAIAAYMAFPIEDGDPGAIRLNNLFIGLGIALALLAIGIGAVHWGKALMADHEGIDLRHPVKGTDETRARAVEIFQEANEESGFGRRTLIRNSLVGALIAFPLPAVVLFRGLAPQNENPVELLSQTMWKKGLRLTLDPTGTPIKAADVTLGSAFQVIPEGLAEMESGRLEAKAKAAVLLMRLKPEDLHELPDRKSWSYDGIVAYSKICTHVGCPVALYEQQTHHLLCPCHQSQFDVANHAKVIFGPAARPLPQLPIAVDDEGYLIAQSDFTEPVGPSFWERP
ncbi:ubiquinol-cytochrome c reductase iron-sulfur subunit [Compostimonas suwonensis]|uniref:Cytochrome bc1 complex Rieske iron-sulfur subunit n=1 Tax=Compostimonas suwonensis TaxID=1048394 RepID=A0A2M9BAV3_9MICO|nr:ubiquinol-cytochrome c reductase iron-sulfur subunit [Compostimonas suwonensis]PJJ55069.1 ubiquinol-cytochrome c reductase iron-sulfur subunit [Compostimonas suwonensis]